MFHDSIDINKFLTSSNHETFACSVLPTLVGEAINFTHLRREIILPFDMLTLEEK